MLNKGWARHQLLRLKGLSQTDAGGQMILCWRLPVARPPEATKPICSEPRRSKFDPKGMGVISFARKAFAAICLPLNVARYRLLVLLSLLESMLE